MRYLKGEIDFVRHCTAFITKRGGTKKVHEKSSQLLYVKKYWEWMTSLLLLQKHAQPHLGEIEGSEIRLFRHLLEFAADLDQ
jgi:hypothetical protein